LNAVDGDNAAAPSSRARPGVSPLHFNSQPAERNRASPRKLPPMPVVIWSLSEGSVVSPAISHSQLPANV
jgi:hypothetical protein